MPNIFIQNNYGKIKLKLKKLLDKKGITRNFLANAIHIRFEVVDRWCNKDINKIDADILAKICFMLQCGILDIIEYEKPDKK